MYDQVSFGTWVKRRRKSLDLTQSKLAEKVYCSLATIQKIEIDERRPSRSLAELLASALEVPENDLPIFLKVARGERTTDRLVGSHPFNRELLALESTSLPRRSNLPIQSTSLLGRAAELEALNHLLAQKDCRLLTILGPGGIGKTRLAIAAAVDIQDQFANGAWFVSLAPLNKPEFIIPAIASALELMLTGPAEPQTQLLHYLHDKKMLLVLDNFEHLISGVAVLVDLLQSAPEVKLLVTSHERLNLQDEWVYDLPGLPIPVSGDVRGIEENSAVQLFLRSAQRIKASFTLSDQNREAIVQICRRVDGMPLGIELAAAWIRTLTCREIADEIERSLDFLAFSARDRPQRHQSMRAVFDHSWQLLSSQEQQVLRQLSVFRGGFERQAASEIAGATLPTLSVLADKSLLSQMGEARYDLHELVRQYAATKLSEAREEEVTRERHFDYYQSLAEVAAPHLISAERDTWLDHLEAEHSNIRAALGWCQGQTGSGESMLLLAGALCWFWSHRGYINEGRAWLMSALSRADDSATSFARARALYGAARLSGEEGNFQAARLLLEKSVTLWRALGSQGRHGLAHSLINLGLYTRDAGDLALAHTLAVESVSLFREMDDRWGLAYALSMYAIVIRDETDYDEAGRLCEESIRLWHELGDTWGLSTALHLYGLVALRQGDYLAARSHLLEALPLTRQYGHKPVIGYVLLSLGYVSLNLRDFNDVEYYLQQSQAIFYDIGDKYGIANSLQIKGYLALLAGDDYTAQTLFDQGLPLAREAGPKWICPMYLARYVGLAGIRGMPLQALRLWAAAEALITASASYMDASDRYIYEKTIAPSLVTLDDASIQAAQAEGRSMSLEQAIAYAKQVVGPQ